MRDTSPAKDEQVGSLLKVVECSFLLYLVVFYLHHRGFNSKRAWTTVEDGDLRVQMEVIEDVLSFRWRNVTKLVCRRSSNWDVGCPDQFESNWAVWHAKTDPASLSSDQ